VARAHGGDNPGMSFHVDIGHSSERGPRSVNEDFGGATAAAPPDDARGLIAAVADGVSSGGHGLEAAQTTVMGLLADFFATPATWETTVALDRLIGAQNAWLASHNQRRQGAGAEAALTTLTALVLHGQTWTLAHVGDTRAGLLRAARDGAAGEGEITQLSHDHAFDHPDQRSRLTRAVGLDDVVRIDFAQGDVRAGDVFLLTSDGVHGVLKPRQLAGLLRGEGTAQDASGALVRAALAAGSRDNATALVVRVAGLDARQLHDELADVRRLPAPPLLKIGDVVDGMSITAVVMDNGVHLLYQARCAESRELVALKTLHPARAGDMEERAMLAHEAWLGQRVGGRGEGGFVRVRERAAHAGALYVVFDWHHGRTLEQLMQGKQRPGVAEAVAAAIAWSRALGRLHRQGVVHRDIKPGNLHLGDDGAWRILDLGAAISGRETQAQRELHAGTPSYMNPEQWEEGGAAHAGSDLFALGATLYQWLTGRLPYGEIEPYQTARYRRDPVPASRLRPDVPMWLDHVLRKAVARDPKQRFETAEELLLALERGASRPLQALGGTPLARRDPVLLWQAALACSLLFNALLILWLLFLPR
jgi:serine/threonine protein phosphatase PrpC